MLLLNMNLFCKLLSEYIYLIDLNQNIRKLNSNQESDLYFYILINLRAS